MKAIVTTVNPVKFGQPPFLTSIIEDANAQELNDDFLFIYKRSPGLFIGSTVLEDRAVFKAADVVKVIFEKDKKEG